MKTFFNVEDLGDLKAALAEAQEVKKNRFAYQELGKNKTLLMIFFNNSLLDSVSSSLRCSSHRHSFVSFGTSFM